MKKSLIIKSLIILLIVSAASCSKDALRNHDLEGQLDATESVNDAFLLAYIIKQSFLFY